MEIWLAIIGAGLVTYATRAVPLLLPVSLPESGPARRYLDALPTSIIAALAGAAIIAPEQRLACGPELPASVAVIAVVAWRRNLLLGVIAGVVVVAALRSL